MHRERHAVARTLDSVEQHVQLAGSCVDIPSRNMSVQKSVPQNTFFFGALHRCCYVETLLIKLALYSWLLPQSHYYVELLKESIVRLVPRSTELQM